MITPNMHYRDLKESYLFAGIAQKVKKYQMEHPEKHIYRMGIGDVSLPLCDAVIKALHEGVADQANKETFHGYMPECGAQFLRETVAGYYAERGVILDADEVFERRLADLKETGKASEAQLRDLRDTYREALRSFRQLDEGEGPCAS